jgi:hypothetical protein
VLQLLLQPVTLQNIDDTDEQQQSFPFRVPRGYPPGPAREIPNDFATSIFICLRHVLVFVDGLRLGLDALHGGGMRDQSLPVDGPAPVEGGRADPVVQLALPLAVDHGAAGVSQGALFGHLLEVGARPLLLKPSPVRLCRRSRDSSPLQASPSGLGPSCVSSAANCNP